MNFSPNDFIHPDDRAAREQLEAIPGFETALKAFMKAVPEQYLHGTNMASKIRITATQLPDLYRHLPPLCKRLGIQEPEYYLEMNPMPNAYTYGDSRTFLTVTSGLLECLKEEELDIVLAHECGHIVCRHALYHTMAALLKTAGSSLLGVLTLPMEMALLYWSRCSELSADRAAAVLLDGPTPVVNAMIRFAGGPPQITSGVDVAQYIQQAEAYDQLKAKGWDRLLQTVAILPASHPFAAVRAREILRWCASEDFGILQQAVVRAASGGPICPVCHAKIESGWRFCMGCGTKLEV